MGADEQVYAQRTRGTRGLPPRPTDTRQSGLGEYGTQGTRCDAVLPTSSRLSPTIAKS